MKKLKKLGFTDVILTSHYISNYYENSGKEIKFWVNKLQDIINDKKLKINLHPGMEIYILNEIDELIKDGTIIPLANTKYLLIELPMHSNVKNFDELLFLVQSMGFTIILAHPERYEFVQKNPKTIKNYIEKGCIMQSNFGSIIGIYGTKPQKTIKELLKLDCVHVLASDCHREGTIYKLMPKMLKKLEKIISKEKLFELTTENPQKILNNEDLLIY